MKKFRTKIPDLEFFLYGIHLFGGICDKVSEIVVLKSTQKGLPAPDSDASYNCGFSKGKWPSVSHHDGAAFTLPSMCTKSHAGMAWLTRTSCSRCPCGSTTFQENLTVSAASMSGGAVLFCWVMKDIPII